MPKINPLTSIVIPSNRNSNIISFLNAWKNEFKGCRVIVVEDNPTQSFKIPEGIEHYSWKEINSDLGGDSWIIPRKVAAIRAYGFLKAWQAKSEIIITLDDDCLPEKHYPNGFVEGIKENLDKTWDSDQWWNTISGYKIYPRGYPYAIRKKKQETVIHHGLWSNIPDLDGLTQKKNPFKRTRPFRKVEKIPFGRFFPMCTMNLSFKRKVLPAMYLLLMNQDERGVPWGYDRFDDIWAGLFAKKICDHLGWAVSSGSPSVRHTRASSVEENIKKEAAGIEVNEWLWKKVLSAEIKGKNTINCYGEIAAQIKGINNYFTILSKAMLTWIKILKRYEL